MKDLTKNIWQMEGGKKRTWWWWWLLFFIDNPKNPKEPLQLMVLWSRKKEPHIDCNGVKLRMDDEIERKPGEIRMSGATAAWYYDGKTMHEDFVVTPSKLILSEKEKFISAKESAFVQEGKKFYTWIKGKQAEVEFDALPIKDYPPIHKDHQLGGIFGYNILKINRLKLSGTIRQSGKIEKITGTCYFQKVFVSGPVIPWQWNLTHFANGSYLSYNIGRIGHSLFAEHHSPLDLKLRKKLEFYDAKTKKLYFFRNVSIKRSKGELPMFTLNAKSAQGTLKISLQSYSRALWRLQKSRRHSLNTLYYHEFCVRVKEFQLKTTDGKTITLQNTGLGYGNCEDSKGFMV